MSVEGCSGVRRAAGLLLSAVRAGDIDRQRRAPSAQQQRQLFEILRCSKPMPAISVKAHLNTVDYFNSNKAVCVYCVYICVCIGRFFGSETGVNFLSWISFAFPTMMINLVFSWIVLAFMFIPPRCQ